MGDRITFIVSVEVTKCPENIANRSASFQIYPVGLNEVLKVDLTMACDCSCDTAGISVSIICFSKFQLPLLKLATKNIQNLLMMENVLLFNESEI